MLYVHCFNPGPDLAIPLDPGNVEFGDSNCNNDYIVVPNASEDGSTTYSRDGFCGLTLGPCVEDNTNNCDPMAGPITCMCSLHDVDMPLTIENCTLYEVCTLDD